MPSPVPFTPTERSSTQSQPIKNRDLYQQVTDTIIAQLETGVVPWMKPWQADGVSFAIPFNGNTGKHYQGINIVLLWTACDQKNLGSHEWASFKQWQEKKELIRKGEKGTTIIYYDTFEKDIDGEVQKIPFIKSSIVFNRSQLQSWQPQPAAPKQPFVERLPAIDAFITNTMPTCTRQEAYYSTLSHELIHWTGHPSRLDRSKGKKFGDQAYAAEELIAELGAAFFCCELDITAELKQDHASYIANWLQVLKNDKTFIVKASSEASKAVGYLKAFQP